MKYKIALFPGEGVGPELIKEGVKAVEKAAELEKFDVEWLRYDEESGLGENERTVPEKILEQIKNSCNSVYCGTFSNSAAIRDFLGQHILIRPIRLFPTVESVIAGKSHKDIDFVLVRENSEDFYMGLYGKAKAGKSRNQHDINRNGLKVKLGMSIESRDDELSYQIGLLSRKGCERVIKYAFEYAKSNGRKKITFVDKANVLESYNFWRESVQKLAKDFPDVECEFSLIDLALVNIIRQPEAYSMMVAPNMFGDMLGDLGTTIQGGLSFAARASINPSGISLFEPAHGSAPKLKDKGIVNPIATIWAGAMMLESMGQKKSANLIVSAIESVLREGKIRTQDLDGNNSTYEMGDAIVDKMVDIYK